MISDMSDAKALVPVAQHMGRHPILNLPAYPVAVLKAFSLSAIDVLSLI